MSTKQTVFVGLSGGVDSSVAALRLISEGYNVVGVFIKVWHPDFLQCNWEEERLDAMRVAAHLDIPFLTCDAVEDYKTEVADYFISEYKNGRTPNPDVMCNKSVKFGAFLNFAINNGADYIATGHYASRINVEEGFVLKRGVDGNKDQTYFLWTLTQDQITKVLLPVGRSPKKQIREEAKNAGIPVATKKDSQGICFLGQVDIPDFLSHYIDLVKGDVLNNEGEIIGSHKGSLVYTLGQRHGFDIYSKGTDQVPHYVVARDIEKNTITVSSSKLVTEKNNQLTLTSLSWINKSSIVGQRVAIQTRYRQTSFEALITKISKDSIVLDIADEQGVAASGQSCVLYDKEVCLGGGIIA